MFIPIQQQQGTFADGYTVPPLRTGYEQVIAQRTTSIFASNAKDDGKVVRVTGRAMTVEYKDGTQEHIELGVRPGRASNVIYPQRITARLAEGDTFKKGDNLSYNSNYFTPDAYNPNQVSLKMGVMAKTALVDTIDTFEDSCAVSAEMAGKLNTQLMELRVIEVRFDQYVKNLVKVGDTVDIESILCTIEDPETAEHGEFDEMALDTIRRLTAMSPRAKAKGVVSRIEWFYHGDLEDIGGNLREQVDAADRERRLQARALGQKYLSGQVDTSFRIRGRALDQDMVAIRVYIDVNIGAGIGD